MKKMFFLLAAVLSAAVMADVPLLKNGDFSEKTSVGLPKFWQVRCKDVKSVQVYDSGSGNAVKMMPQVKERMFLIQYPTQKLIPGTFYKVSYEVKSDRKSAHRVYFDYRDGFDKLCCNDGSWNSTPAEWTKQSFTFFYPPKASGGYLVLNPNNNAGDVVEFRNVSFEVAPDGNVLKNADFSRCNINGNLKNWFLLGKGSIAGADGVLQLASPGGKTINAAQWDIPIVPGQKYKVSAEVRAKTPGSFRIYVEWRMPDPANPQGKGKLSSTGGWWRKVGTDWKKDTFEITYPEKGKAAYLILSGNGSEVVEFRNVKVEAVNKDVSPAAAAPQEDKKAQDIKKNDIVKETAVKEAEVSADGNLTKNPAFAVNEKGKITDWNLLSGKMEAVDGALRVYNKEGGKSGFVSQWDIRVQPGKSYKVTVDVRANSPGACRVYCEWRMPDPANPKAKGKLSSYGGWWRNVGTKWQKDEIVVNVPANARGPYLVLAGRTSEYVEFRNVRIEETESSIPKEAALAGGTWKISNTAKFTVKDGKAILTITPINGKNGDVVLAGVKIQPGKRYALNYTLQGKGAAGSDTGFHPFRISVKIPGVQDDGGPWDDTQNGIRSKSFEFTVPEKIAGNSAEIKIETTTRGSIDFWNLEFKELPPRPVELLKVQMISPFFRDTLFPGTAENRIEAEIFAKTSAALVELSDAKGKKIVSKSVAIKNGKGDFFIPAADLKTGEYTLSISADINGQKVVAGRTITKLSPATSYTTFNGKYFIANGKKFVPVTCWSIAGTTPDQSDEQIERGYYYAAKNGFNSAMFRPSNCETALRYLNIAQKYGIKLFLCTGNSPSGNPNTVALWEHKVSGVLTKEVITHPALLGYFLVDEPYWRGIPSAGLIASYKVLKFIDPYHPVWINAAPRGSVEVHAEYSKAADIYGVDVYPVGSKGHSGLEDKGLSSIGKYVYRMQKSCGPNKPIFMALQGFAWRKDAPYPTFDELRFMSYDAITSGGIGVSYWGTPGVDKAEFYKDVLYPISREFMQISGVLTAEKVANVKVSNAAVHIFARVVDGKNYVIAANASDQKLEVTFNGVNNGKLTVVNENRSVTANGGSFTDSFAPYAVHIYAEGALPAPAYGASAVNSTFEAQENPVFTHMKEMLSRVPYSGNASWLWVKGLERQAYSKVLLCKEFTLDKTVKSARLVISADDTYEVWINGKAADDGFPKSGVWDLADVIDVTKFVKSGANTIAITGADGGVVPCGVIADLIITFSDGTTARVVTDGSWKALGGNKIDNWQDPAVFNKWENAVVIAPYGSGPWSNKMQMKNIDLLK